MLDFFTNGLNISFKKIISLVLIFSLNFSSMYLYYSFLIKDMINEYYSSADAVIFGNTLFYITLIGSVLISSLICDKISRRKLLLIWVLFGVMSLSLLTILKNPSTIFYLIGLVGFSFGIGIPSCFAALVDYTKVEERGRISGLTQFSIFFLLLIIIMMFIIF